MLPNLSSISINAKRGRESGNLNESLPIASVTTNLVNNMIYEVAACSPFQVTMEHVSASVNRSEQTLRLGVYQVNTDKRSIFGFTAFLPNDENVTNSPLKLKRFESNGIFRWQKGDCAQTIKHAIKAAVAATKTVFPNIEEIIYRDIAVTDYYDIHFDEDLIERDLNRWSNFNTFEDYEREINKQFYRFRYYKKLGFTFKKSFDIEAKVRQAAQAVWEMVGERNDDDVVFQYHRDIEFDTYVKISDHPDYLEFKGNLVKIASGD
jgi:hypothetical protein